MNNTHTEADVPTPLYGRIVEFSAWAYCCDEQMAACPDCGATFCVFCEDECTCGTPIF
jgi:hypothetical protein